MSGQKTGNVPAALILSAGYSSRMFGLKALYPVGEELMLNRTIRAAAEGSIDKIYIVTGNKKELIETAVEAVSGAQINYIENPDYKHGMFSSVLAGVKQLSGEQCPGFMLFPVDCPFIKAETIRLLLNRFAETSADIISPVCAQSNGHHPEGHPPVIRSTVFKGIVSADSPSGGDKSGPEGGLASILNQTQYVKETFDVEDPGILDDVDDDAAYQRLLFKYGFDPAARYPAALEIERLIKSKTPPARVIRHMEKTAALAVDYAERLNSRGARLKIGLLYAAAMLHDVCRSEPDHAEAGARYLSDDGYPAVGRIVSQHMDIDHAENDSLDEAAVLYLADKMLEGEHQVELQKRMNDKLRQFAGNEEACRNIKSRFEKAALIQRKVSAVLSG